jgi:two-component sensor histidine kinase
MTKDVVSFDLLFWPTVPQMYAVRTFVTDFFINVVDDPDVVSRLALVTHELLENAIKYSVAGKTRLHVTFDRKDGRAAIRISNHARPKHVRSLLRNVGQLNATRDLDAYYRTAMKRSARRPNGSGLGLVRISAEAKMSIRVQVRDSEVRITARLHAKAAAP